MRSGREQSIPISVWRYWFVRIAIVALCSCPECWASDRPAEHTECDSIIGEHPAEMPAGVKSLSIHSNLSLTKDECLVVKDLAIDDGVTIQTNGHNLSIVAFGDLNINGKAAIRSFDVDQLASQLIKPLTPGKTPRGVAFDPRHTGAAQNQGRAGGTGAGGTLGTPGVDGHDAGSLRIYISGAAKGNLSILNIGSNGGPGGDGGEGGDGGTGEQGGKSTSVTNNFLGITWYSCGSGPGYGGHGGNGGTGGAAGPGGRAGNGGDINVWVLGNSQGFEIAEVSSSAGSPGEPGVPGSGGRRGCEGFGGLGGPACSGMETKRGCDGCAGSNGADGAVQLLRSGKDANNNLKWFPFFTSVDHPVEQDECGDFGNTPPNESSANEQIADLWDLLSPTFKALKSSKVSTPNGTEASVVQLIGGTTKWEDILEASTYTLTQSPPTTPGNCALLNPRILFGNVLQKVKPSGTPDDWSAALQSTLETQPPPSAECLQTLTTSAQVELIDSFERLTYLLSLLRLYAAELSRKSILVDIGQVQPGTVWPLEPSGVYFKWPHASAGKQAFTKLDDETLSRLARMTNLLLDKTRSAIGSGNTSKATFVCSENGFQAGGFTIDQLPSTFPDLDVSTGASTLLYGSGKDFGFTLQIKSSNKRSYLALRDGVVSPVSTASKAFCNYTELIRKRQFDSYACTGEGMTEQIVTVLRNPLYHPSSSVFFYDLLYLESFFKSENLTGFNIDAVQLVTQPDCVDYP